MPYLIVAALLLWLLFIVLKFMLHLAVLVAGPVLLGWLVFVAMRTHLRQQLTARAQPLWAGLLVLVPGQQLVFAAHPQPQNLLLPPTKALADARWAAAGVAGWAYHWLFNSGRFAPVAEGTVVSAHTAAGLGLLMGAGVLWALVGGAARSEAGHHQYVGKWLAQRVRQLNAQCLNATRFHTEAQQNNQLRTRLGGAPDVALHRLMTAVQNRWSQVADAPHALQSLLDEHTQQTAAENAVLHTLCQRHAEVLQAYDHACAEANAVGNEAVFRYLDMVWRALQSLGQLVWQDQWEALGQHLTGAADELAQLRHNIHHMGQADAAPGAGPGADTEPGDDACADPYAVLGVKRGLSAQQLKDVYRKLAQIYHPDKGLVSDPARFQAIQQAWHVIAAEHGL